MNRRTATIIAILLAAALAAGADTPTTKPAPNVRIVLAGDSTVTEKAGWGLGFAALLRDDVQLLNHARGGRSSRTFREEGSWEKVLATKADYVLIQFGHNDEPGTNRSTDRETEFPKFMRQYVEEARAAGIKPILVTPLVRRQFKDDGKIQSSLAGHAEIVRTIAKELNVPLVELHDRSLAVCNALGRDACTALLSTEKPTGGYDGTHLTPAGAMLMGAIVAGELKRAAPELAAHVRAVPKSAAATSTAPATTRPAGSPS
jgi:pectinesterase